MSIETLLATRLRTSPCRCLRCNIWLRSRTEPQGTGARWCSKGLGSKLNPVLRPFRPVSDCISRPDELSFGGGRAKTNEKMASHLRSGRPSSHRRQLPCRGKGVCSHRAAVASNHPASHCLASHCLVSVGGLGPHPGPPLRMPLALDPGHAGSPLPPPLHPNPPRLHDPLSTLVEPGRDAR